MYKSPVDITYCPVELQLEGDILQAVQKVGISVDKDELLRALKYDRDQYDKGYKDGIADAAVHGKWEFWEGWIGNHDMRIDDATCSNCGYEHPTIRRARGVLETEQEVLNKLFKFCPACGACMDGRSNVPREDY